MELYSLRPTLEALRTSSSALYSSDFPTPPWFTLLQPIWPLSLTLTTLTLGPFPQMLLFSLKTGIFPLTPSTYMINKASLILCSSSPFSPIHICSTLYCSISNSFSIYQIKFCSDLWYNSVPFSQWPISWLKYQGFCVHQQPHMIIWTRHCPSSEQYT